MHQPASGRVVFELSGGNVALDFANTYRPRRAERPTEWLRDFSDMAAWASQAGILSDVEGRRVTARIRDRSKRAAHLLRRARTLREAIFAVMSAVAQRRAALASALTTINREVAASFASSAIVSDSEGSSWEWAAPADASERILWRVARATAEILLSPPLRQRVRECECAWLFLDGSRNQSRRWCDMRVCGNRAKARRFRSRSRAG